MGLWIASTFPRPPRALRSQVRRGGPISFPRLARSFLPCFRARSSTGDSLFSSVLDAPSLDPHEPCLSALGITSAWVRPDSNQARASSSLSLPLSEKKLPPKGCI
eukprot:scaffold281_cov318-Pavlova_lutheri.AAC.38